MRLARRYYTHVSLMENSAMTKHLVKEELVAVWQGRIDMEDGEQGRRFHQMVTILDQLDQSTLDQSTHNKPGLMLLGFSCDEGVRRNKGRVGAFHAPNLIRSALANMAWHHDDNNNQSRVYDAGNVTCTDENLAKSQQELAVDVFHALQQKHKVLIFGGGHEVAWGSFQGLSQYLQVIGDTAPKIGIINFDAHFDLRTYSSSDPLYPSSSGTPFRQIADYCLTLGWTFHYACLGVSRASNTEALFNQADTLNVLYREDKELVSHLLEKRLTELEHFIDNVDYLYLTIDLDVFSACVAPGVSAPAARGISYETIETLLQPIFNAKKQSGQSKLCLADLAEYNPQFDVDKQTARLASRLAWDISRAMLIP
jgi:formiminoglutamase